VCFMLARVRIPSSPVRKGEREREGGKERERERERVARVHTPSSPARKRERERCRICPELLFSF
jgi:hypothetical protein